MDQTHSGFGVASFIVSTVVGILMFLVFIVAGLMEVSTPGGIDDESAGAMLVGLFLIMLLVIDVVAVGLGIAGLIQKNRKRTFPVLGVVFGGATIVGTIFLVIVGNMM